MKKGIVAVIIILVAVGVVVGVMRLAPPQKPAPRGGKLAPAAQPTRQPVEVVTDYLQALGRKDTRSAYALLSRESQQAHSYDEFVKLNQKGVTAYDLASAKQESKDGKTMVTLSLQEDPSEHSIRLVQEGGEWRVVFLKGLPAFPYEE